MNLCLEPPEDSITPAPSSLSDRVDNWNALLASLRAWYTTRPLDLQPIASLESRGAAFPSVLFTNSAGIFANMMYHTAMTILLNHKPRGIPPLNSSDEAEIAQMSPLWHARRVCGIAVTCDGACWDPCMIAAFFVAARRMTHEEQQKELLACLDRVHSSGWHIDGIIRRLREEWGPFGGS